MVASDKPLLHVAVTEWLVPAAMTATTAAVSRRRTTSMMIYIVLDMIVLQSIWICIAWLYCQQHDQEQQIGYDEAVQHANYGL